MNFLRLTLSNATVPLLHKLAVFTLKIRGYRCLRFETCAFYGTSEFLNLCDKAIRRLAGHDQLIYNAIASGHYMFWYEEAALLHFKRHFSINGSFRAWDDAGLVTFFVYAYHKSLAFDGRVFPMFNHSTVRLVNKEVYRMTKDWLAKHSFPNELIKCYKTE